MSDLMFVLISTPPGPLGNDAAFSQHRGRITVLLAQLHVQSEPLPRQGLPWVPPLTLVHGDQSQWSALLSFVEAAYFTSLLYFFFPYALIFLSQGFS